MTARLVLAGACGRLTGTVVEWSMAKVKATSDCRASPTIYDVTAANFVSGLIETWPTELTLVDPQQFNLSILYHGRLVSPDARIGSVLPAGSLDPTPSGTSTVLIHLVFRSKGQKSSLSGGATDAEQPPKSQQPRPSTTPPTPQPRTQSEGCCVVA